MKVGFTIVTKNYIGLARLLKSSIKTVNPEVLFYIFVADEFDSDSDYKGNNEVLVAKTTLNIPSDIWENMSFKYTLTEFCTAIKPFCFEYLFSETKAEKILYFDPDIYVFNSLDLLFDNLETKSIVLLPHIVVPQTINLSEKVFLQSGIYNLGFLGLKKGDVADNILKWWGSKLKDACFDDVLDYTFTDQKWMNYITALFPQEEIEINRHLGCNVAPWNFYEREIVFDGENPIGIKKRIFPDGVIYTLIFIHYSGYDYLSLIDGKEKRTRRSNYDLKYKDVKLAMSFYAKQIMKDSDAFKSFMSLKYTYGFYDDGTTIDKFHRRLYRSLYLRESIRGPFSTSENSFYVLLKSKGMINAQRTIRSSAKSSAMEMKLSKFNNLMKLLYKILGYKRYLLLLRLLKYFSRFESQIFLVNKKYLRDNIFMMNKFYGKDID
jgi:hypothetical protein